jgi:hypothetical protein
MRGMPERQAEFLMPRANGARGKVRGALPRTPARGKPPETPGPFPFRSRFRNGPRRQGSAPPRKHRAPWTAPGRSEEFPQRRERGQTQRPNRRQPGLPSASRWSAFRLHYQSSNQLNITERRIPRHPPSGSRLLETKLTFRLILRLEYATGRLPGKLRRAAASPSGGPATVRRW